MRRFSLHGLAALQFKKLVAPAVIRRGALGSLLPIAEVKKVLEAELRAGATLPGDPWVKEFERWQKTDPGQRAQYPPGDLRQDEAAAKACRKKPKTKPGECVSSYDRFKQGYQAILIPDLQRYVPFIFKVVFNQRRYFPDDQKETVWLLYQYGCRQISRLMPGFAKIVRRVISNEVDLVGDWSEKISAEGLKQALGTDPKDPKAKGAPRGQKPAEYKPKKEIVEICTVTHRQLEETLKKDLGTIIGANWPPKPQRAAAEANIQPISGPVFPPDALAKLAKKLESGRKGREALGKLFTPIVQGLAGLVNVVKEVPLEKDTNYGGFPYKILKPHGRSAIECQAACWKDPKCKVFGYNAKSNQCLLKASVGKRTAFKGWQSGVKKSAGPAAPPASQKPAKPVKPALSFSVKGFRGLPRVSQRKPTAAPSRIQVFPNADHYGGDYRSFISRGMSDCQQNCVRDNRCKAFTYQRATRRCWLKSRIIRRLPKPGFDTGAKQGGRSSLWPSGRRQSTAPCATRGAAGGDKIVIATATLGGNCGQRKMNHILPLGRACTGKERCTYRAPAQRTDGRCAWALEIEYHCGDRRKRRIYVPGNAWEKPAVTLDCAGRSLLFKELGPYNPKLKGETFHDVAKRLLSFYRKSGSARNFEIAVRATEKSNSVQSLATNVKTEAPGPAQGVDLNDATQKKSVRTRTRRERLRRKVEQWTYGYEYKQLKPVIQNGGSRLLGDYKAAEQVALRDFWNNCKELHSICESPQTASEKFGCVECAKKLLAAHCVSGRASKGGCKGDTKVKIVRLEQAVDGLKTIPNWKEKRTVELSAKTWGGNSFANWLKLKLVQEGNNPNLVRGEDGMSPVEIRKLAARHLVARSFLPPEVNEEKGLDHEGRQLLDALPVTSWQRCVLFNPYYTPGNNGCDWGNTSLDRFKKGRDTLPWENSLLFRSALDSVQVRSYFKAVNDFWSRRDRCNNPQWKSRGDCKNWARFGRNAATQVFAGSSKTDGFDRDGQMRDAGDSIGNTLGPVIGKLLGFLLKAAGMYEMMKTLAKAAGLTPEQSIDCEDAEYRQQVLQIARNGKMDNKRGCLLKVFAKNFVNVLESIIIMLGNKLVDWGVDLLRTVLQPVKSAIITAAGSVPFVGGVLATIVDIAWELLMNFGAKMLLKSFVVAKLPEWLQIRKMSQKSIEELFEEPIVAAVVGIILQLIQAAVDYGDKSIANVAAATAIGIVQEALYATKDKNGNPPMFWIRALLYAKREFVKENISSSDPGEVILGLAKGMIRGFKAALKRKINDKETAQEFDKAVEDMIHYVENERNLGQKILSKPLEELTKIIGKYVAPIVMPIVTALVEMPEWAKKMLNTFGQKLKKTINEILPEGGGRGEVKGWTIFGRVIDVLKPAGAALLEELKVDQDLKDVILKAYNGLTGALGEGQIEHIEEYYLTKPWRIVEGVVDVAGRFITKKIGDLISDPRLKPEQNLVKGLLTMILDILSKKDRREAILPPQGTFQFEKLLKELAVPLGNYATERLGELAAGSGLEGLVALLVDEVFGADGPFQKGAAYFERNNLLDRLARRGPEIASNAMDAVAGLVTEKGFGGPILGSLVTGVAKALRKAVESRPQTPAQVIGLVVEAFSPVVETLVAEIPGAGANQPLGKILRPVLRKVLGFFGTAENLSRLAQGPQALEGLAREIGGGVADGLKAILGDLVRQAGDAALKPVTDKAIESLFRMLSDPARLQRLQGDAVLELVKDVGGALLAYVGAKVSGAVGRGQPAAIKAAIESLLGSVVREITQIVGDPAKMRSLVSGGAAGVAALVARVVREPLGKLVDARLPQAARGPVKTAMGEIFGIVGDPQKLRALGTTAVSGLLGKLAPVVKQLLLGIFTQAVPAAELAPIRSALDKLGAGLASPGAATPEIRTAIGQTVWGAVLRIKDERLRGLATNLVSLARDLVASGAAQLRGDAKEILRRIGDTAVRFAQALLPASPIRELVSAMLESVSGLFAFAGGLQRSFVQPAQDVLRPITEAFSRLMRDVLQRAISSPPVAALAAGLLDEVLGFFGNAASWRQLRENGVGFVFSRLIPIGRDFTVAMLARVKGTGSQIMSNVIRSLFTFAAGMFEGGAEAMRNFSTNAVSALISMGVGALKPVVVGFVRQATRSEPFAQFIDEAMGELSSVLSNPRQLQGLLAGNATQAFDKLLAKAKGMVKRLIGGVLRDPSVRKLAEEGLEAVLDFAKNAVGGRNLGEAAKDILKKVLPAFVEFAKAKLMPLIPEKLDVIKQLAGKWFDRLKTLVGDLVSNPGQVWNRIRTAGGEILSILVGDVVEVVQKPLSKLIGWAPLRDLVSNILREVGNMLKKPNELLSAFKGQGWEKPMAFLLPRIEGVVGPFAEAVLVTPLKDGAGKEILKTLVGAVRSVLKDPKKRLFKYVKAKGNAVLKCLVSDIRELFFRKLPPTLSDLLGKIIDEMLNKAIGGASCPQ